MTIKSLGWVEFKTHRVTVSQDDLTHRIYCFKHTKTRCELASFDQEDLAAEFIITPMQTVEYYLNLDED